MALLKKYTGERRQKYKDGKSISVFKAAIINILKLKTLDQTVM